MATVRLRRHPRREPAGVRATAPAAAQSRAAPPQDVEQPPETFLVTTLPGLEDVVASELATKLPAAAVRETLRGRLLVSYGGPAGDLLRLRTIDNAYAVVARFGVGAHRVDLAALERTVAGLDLEAAVRRGGVLETGATGSPTFLVNASRSGTQTYSRHEAAAAAARGIQSRYPAWREGATNRHDLEFRLDVEGGTALFSLRLTPPAFRFRVAERQFTAAALRPPVAHALVWLSGPLGPLPEDVFIDPFCGSGTILAERATYPARRIAGGDLDAAALAAARANLGPGWPGTLLRWDARRLPLRSGTVTKLVTNLPFGRQILDARAIDALYQAFAAETARILAPGGTATVLTDQVDSLRAAADRHGLAYETLASVSLKGLRPEVVRLTPP
jgi:23S rRNA G2445 N2-methylase RlmL